MVVRIARRMRRLVARPGDVPLALRIGWFVVRAPADLARTNLPEFLARLRDSPRPPADDLAAGKERVRRLTRAWLRLPVLRRRNTCYIRALTLYRFLDPCGREVRLHLGIEEPDGASGTPRGHAWVSVDGVLLEGLPAALISRVREIDIRAVAG